MGITDDAVYSVNFYPAQDIKNFFYGPVDNKTFTYSADGKLCKDRYLNLFIPFLADTDTSLQSIIPYFARNYVSDTAYFNPSIITDGKGTAEVYVTMPDSPGIWRVTASSVSKNNEVGETIKKVTVMK